MKADAKAKAFLARGPAANGVPAGLVTAEAARALAAPITDLELASEIAEGGADAAIAAFRRGWKERGEPPVSEADVNLAADGYVAAGNREKALDYSRKAIALLEADKAMSDDRRKLIRQSIDEKLERLKRLTP